MAGRQVGSAGKRAFYGSTAIAALIAGSLALASPAAAQFTGGAGGDGAGTGGGGGGLAGDGNAAGDGFAGGNGGAPGGATPGSGPAGGGLGLGGGPESGGGGSNGGGALVFGGGGGGGGGRGTTLTGADPTLAVTATGGLGGAGADTSTNGGGGGGGGNGAAFTGTGTLTVNQAVTGGAGGSGGDIGGVTGGPWLGGSGGGGGNGLVVTSSGVTLAINAGVTGGAGGAGGAALGVGGTAGAAGAGGIGILTTALNTTVNLANTVSGGLSGDGVTRNFALSFQSAQGFLNLNAGWGINGGIEVSNFLVLTTAGAATISNVISGAGQVNFGGGPIILTGNNTYTGGSVTATTLQLGNGGTSGAIIGNIGNFGSVVFNRSDTVTFSGLIQGSGSITQAGTGTLILTGENTFGGTTTVNAGATLQLGDGGTTGRIGNGNVVNDGVLQANRTNNVTLAGNISGNGQLRNVGTGSFAVTGTNTYTGGTFVDSGLFSVGIGGATGSIVGNVTVANGATFSIFRNNLYQFDGVISGGGGFIHAGTGTTILTGANTYTSGTAIVAGILQLGNGGTTGSIVGDVTTFAGATLAFNRSNLYQFDGVISGAGGVIQAGTGQTLLTGDNTYTGGTVITAGILQLGTGAGLTGSILGNVSVGAGASFAIVRSNTYQFDGTISGAGLVGLIGSGTVIFTANHNYAGGTVIADGTLRLGNGGTTGAITGNVNVFNAAATLAFNRSNAYQFDGVISGAGAVNQIGTGTTTLTAANTYTGATSVMGGTLVVNGSIATSSGLTVFAGATVGGTGTLPASVVGGTLAPGNSIGTINVAGNLTFAGTGVYLVEVGTAAADRTNVSGTASLAGTVRFTPGGGALSFFTRYTILNATGGVNGTFGTVENLLGSAVRTTVSYDANNVFLQLDPNALLPILAGTPLTVNQQAVAAAFDRAVANGADPSAFLNLFLLPASRLPAALDQLSGQVHTGTQGLGVLVSGQFLNVMLDPFALGRTPGANPALAYAPDALAGLPGVVAATQAADLASGVEVIDTRRFAVWAAAFGSDGRIGGDAVIGSVRRSERSTGIAAGVDVRVAPGSILGFALAGGGADASLSSGLGSVSAEVFQAGLYGMTRFGFLDLRGALAYSRLEVDTVRAIPALGVAQVNGSYDADVWSGRLEAAVPVTFAGLSVSPVAAIQAQSVRTGAFTETVPGGGAGALAVDGRTSTTTRGELGVRLEGRFGGPGLEATAFARLAWAHYFERDANVGAAFVGLPGSNFTVIGARPDRDSALISTGLDVRITPQLSIGARFDGEFSQNVSQYAGTARIRFEF